MLITFRKTCMILKNYSNKVMCKNNKSYKRNITIIQKYIPEMRISVRFEGSILYRADPTRKMRSPTTLQLLL